MSSAVDGQPSGETIEQRIARGKAQNTTDNGAIVPFPAPADFGDTWQVKGWDSNWLFEHTNDGWELTTHVYRSAAGEPIFAVLRADHPTEAKAIRPLRAERVIGCMARARLKHLDGIRPIYHLDVLEARPDDPVFVAEGENAADAAQSLFPDHVCITWAGGAQCVGLVEVLPLVGRNVTIWPDNDASGKEAARKLAARLLKAGAASCRIVAVPDAWPKGWDVADLEDDNDITPEAARRLLDEAPRVTWEQVAPAGENERRTKAGDGPPPSPNLARDEDIFRFLIAKEAINLNGRTEWIRVGLALKASHGEAGLDLWNRLSSETNCYDEDELNHEWETFKDRPDRPLTMATYAKMAMDAGWTVAGRERGKPAGGGGQAGGGPGGSAGSSGGGSRKPPGDDNEGASAISFGRGHDPAAAAIQLADEAGDEFWLDQHDKPHASYRVRLPDGTDVIRHAPIIGQTYGGVLRRRYYEAAGKVLHKEAVSNAAALLAFKAEETGLRFTSWLRVGQLGNATYVDLGRDDGAVVEIDPFGWRIVRDAPVRFVRGSRGQLPNPLSGGTLRDFERHFNVSREDVIRTVAFMIGTFNTSGSYPILFIDGEQGTGKSIFADLVVALTDPPTGGAKSARFSLAADEKDLHVMAKGARVLYFDNVSSLSAPAADAMCRMATGAGSASRKLYTDDEETRIVVLRPVIATSIGLPSARADLLSRAVRVRTLPVQDRKAESVVMRAFDADQPKLLGFLLDCVSAALCNREAVEQAVARREIRLPRMGDFAQWVEGAAEKLGLRRGEFSSLMEDEQGKLQRDAAQNHPVGSSLIRYFSGAGNEQIDASAREVLQLLKPYALNERYLPAANKLRGELTRIAPGLRLIGIEFEMEEASGHANVIRFRIRRTSLFQSDGQAGANGDIKDPF